MHRAVSTQPKKGLRAPTVKKIEPVVFPKKLSKYFSSTLLQEMGVQPIEPLALDPKSQAQVVQQQEVQQHQQQESAGIDFTDEEEQEIQQEETAIEERLRRTGKVFLILV